jgi:hypothetical protein
MGVNDRKKEDADQSRYRTGHAAETKFCCQRDIPRFIYHKVRIRILWGEIWLAIVKDGASDLESK